MLFKLIQNERGHAKLIEKCTVRKLEHQSICVYFLIDLGNIDFQEQDFGLPFTRDEYHLFCRRPNDWSLIYLEMII